MKHSRIALRFMAVLLAASAVACGGTVDDSEAGGWTVESRKAYTLEQYQQQLAPEAREEAAGPQAERGVSAMYIGTYCDEIKCCTAEGYCCWWDAGPRPICHQT